MQLAFLSGLTFTIDSNGDTTTSVGEWTDVNSEGNNESINAGTYSLAVNSGTELSLGSLPNEIFSTSIENISLLGWNSLLSSIASIILDIGISPSVVDTTVTDHAISNAQSFLQQQDKFLEEAGSAVDRIAELKTFSSDVLKSDFDKNLYNLEFGALQTFLFDLSQGSYNSIPLFDSNGTVPFATRGSDFSVDLGSGENLNLKNLALLTAITFDLNANGDANTTDGSWNDANEGGDNSEISAGIYSFAVSTGKILQLESISSQAIISSLENIVTLRSINGQKQQELNLLIDHNGTDLGGDHNGTDPDRSQWYPRIAGFCTHYESSRNFDRWIRTSGLVRS